MKVFWSYTASGTQFDGCVATNKKMARLTIEHKYRHPDSAHEAHMLDGMTIEQMDDVSIDQWVIEQLAREENLAPSSETVDRLCTAMQAMTERRAALRDAARRGEEDASMRAGDI